MVLRSMVEYLNTVTTQIGTRQPLKLDSPTPILFGFVIQLRQSRRGTQSGHRQGTNHCADGHANEKTSHKVSSIGGVMPQ
jgi:hypothetical protein